MENPKVFVSYSWSNPEHEQWVLNLATELRESGVDVILDKWDLKEGHDAFAFMEQMVTNADIKKVIIVCDERYSLKADDRAGGVGTEAQIISKEVYENQVQDKFVAVVREKDKTGKAFLPTYYKSRIYIDLSEPDLYTENFERLLRWIFNKPLYKKPDVGAIPSFITEVEQISLGTGAILNRCIDAIKNNKNYDEGILGEYCNTFALNLERFRLLHSDGEFDDAVVKSIEEFLPYRNEFLQLIIVIAQYSPKVEYIERIHRFFENLIPYMFPPLNVTRYHEIEFDNFKFIIHELFLLSLAMLVKNERFEQANILLGDRYYLLRNSTFGRDVMVNFSIFENHIVSLKHRNDRLKLGRISIQADLLKKRCDLTGTEFRYLLQADFIAYMRSEIDSNGNNDLWWPETLCYIGSYNQPFEVFARAISKKYFNKMKILLSIETPQDLEPVFNGYKANPRYLPKWGSHSLDPMGLIGYKSLDTIP